MTYLKITTKLKKLINNPIIYSVYLLNKFIYSLGLYKLIPNKYMLLSCNCGKIFLNLRESSMMMARYLGIYEYKKTKLIYKFIKPGMVILDIGVNKGYYTLLFSKLVSNKGTVFSFEPDPENFMWAKKSIAKNKRNNIRLLQTAISKKDGKLYLYKGDTSGSSSLIYNQGLGEIKVKSRKLDTIVRDNNISNIDVIKIDVEGAELDVLTGAVKTLKKYKPKLIIDIHSINRKKLFDILNKLDYKIFDYSGQKLKKLTKYDFLTKDADEILATV